MTTETDNSLFKPVVSLYGSEIPAASLVMKSGINSDGIQQVTRPNADNIAAGRLMITPLNFVIPATGPGLAAEATGGGLVTVSGSPSDGAEVGSAADSFEVTTGKTGFLANGTNDGLCSISSAGGSGSSSVLIYEAIGDESGGSIQIKALNIDGSLSGDAITASVLPS